MPYETPVLTHYCYWEKSRTEHVSSDGSQPLLMEQWRMDSALMTCSVDCLASLGDDDECKGNTKRSSRSQQPKMSPHRSPVQHQQTSNWRLMNLVHCEPQGGSSLKNKQQIHNIVYLHPVAHRYFTFTFLVQCLRGLSMFKTLYSVFNTCHFIKSLNTTCFGLNWPSSSVKNCLIRKLL
jgi:hypothetical protein